MAGLGVALVLVAGAVWSARVDARREREHRAEMDRIAREGTQERERLFTREQRDDIDNFAKRLNESNGKH